MLLVHDGLGFAIILAHDDLSDVVVDDVVQGT
jgi:hypothetical protein